MNYRKGFDRIGFVFSWITTGTWFVFLCTYLSKLNKPIEFARFAGFSFITCLILFGLTFVTWVILVEIGYYITKLFLWIADGFKQLEGEN